jgi:dipeptidase E
MKRLFLASSVNFVASDIAKKIDRKDLKLLFITTPVEGEHAGEEEPEWLKNDRDSLINSGFIVDDYTITDKDLNEIENELKTHDVIYISGGNTFYLLEKIQQTGCAKAIRDEVNNGKIYIGSSAGSVIAGPDIYPVLRLDDPKKAPNLKGHEGIGIVDFVALPHWGSEKFKELYLNQRLDHIYGINNKYILLNDYQYIEVEDDKYKIVEVEH